MFLGLVRPSSATVLFSDAVLCPPHVASEPAFNHGRDVRQLVS